MSTSLRKVSDTKRNTTSRNTSRNTTRKLYSENVYLRQSGATVLACISDPDEIKSLGGKEVDSSVCLVLDQTLFFPEGGGQPCDLGSIGLWPVLYVFEKDGVVYHQILPEPGSHLIGARVSCLLDWDRRFRHMQRHCGEHILSAVFYDLCGGINRGFHMGEEYMTIDIRLENRPDIQTMTGELIAAIEWEANRMIWDDLPVSVRHFKTKEEAMGLPMRKALAIDEEITLVCVGDENNASGCVACCGTHPSTTGQVGLIKIYKWESYKGMYRITFDAGAAALSNYREQAEVLMILGQRYSSDARGLIGKIDAREQKEQEIHNELHALKKAYLNEQKNEILNAANCQSPSSGHCKPLIREYAFLKPDDLAALSRLLPKDLPGLTVLVATGENTAILYSSGSPDCAKIVKDNAGIWKGRGGGRPDSARVMFPSRQDLECFLDFVQKAY